MEPIVGRGLPHISRVNDQMPFVYSIDHTRRLVLAYARGVVSAEDVLSYQREVWSRPDVAGYNELVDMSAAERIVVPSGESVRELAALSASMDSPSTPSRFAIVAPTGVEFWLARMYEARRGMEERSTKQVGVFRTLEQAYAFLGLSGDNADSEKS
jgi:hypothetical protein